MGGMPELRRFFFWWLSRWLAGVVSSCVSGAASRSGGVEGGSAGSDSGCGACEASEARRDASEAAEDEVASRMYSTTSQVCSVASGANETRRLAVGAGQTRFSCAGVGCAVPSDLRRASLRFLSSSALDDRIDLTAGTKADCARLLALDSLRRRALAVPTHLPAVPAARLQRRLVLLVEAAGADAPRALLLGRCSLGRQRRRPERRARDEPVGNVLVAVGARHGVVVARGGGVSCLVPCAAAPT